MLEPWIIEQIRKREDEERRRRYERQPLVPTPSPSGDSLNEEPETIPGERGVVIISL